MYLKYGDTAFPKKKNPVKAAKITRNCVGETKSKDLFVYTFAFVNLTLFSLSYHALQVENEGTDLVSEVLLAFPDNQAKKLAHLVATPNEGKGKTKNSAVSLPVEVVQPDGMPPALTFYSVYLPKGLGKGDTFTLDVLAVFTHALQPFPEKISQADIQLVVFYETAHYLSPYMVKVQSLSVKLPDARIESFTKIENAKIQGSEIKYGPYENLPPFSYSPIVVHFEGNQPFAVAQELERELEISHWGSVQVTEHYNLIHGGAQSKGEFSRSVLYAFFC